MLLDLTSEMCNVTRSRRATLRTARLVQYNSDSDLQQSPHKNSYDIRIRFQFAKSKSIQNIGKRVRLNVLKAIDFTISRDKARLVRQLIKYVVNRWSIRHVSPAPLTHTTASAP